jgi:polysaccharide biosynthesis protein PslA
VCTLDAELFPITLFIDLGCNAAFCGQKTDLLPSQHDPFDRLEKPMSVASLPARSAQYSVHEQTTTLPDQLTRAPGGFVALTIKRGLDIGGASVLLLALSPLLVGVALAIRLTSPGPVLFRQRRYGVGGEPFHILKFRTMFTRDADISGVNQTRRDDPRVTPLGRILRRANLDELPQLINVLLGDMSLVGPRPHVPGMRAGGMPYEALVPSYFARHRMRPGITGLAQINELRGSTTDAKFARARINYDLAYIDHWSLFLDFRIIWATLRTELLYGTGD